MRIYSDCYQLMSETGRNLWEMGIEVKPKSYQNKIIAGNDDFITKELMAEQYCLTSLNNVEALFAFDKASKPWAEAELHERVTKGIANPGFAYKIRKDLWEQFLTEEGKFDYTYNERIFHKSSIATQPNFDRVIMELVNNPDTRQAILPMYSLHDVQYIGGKKRVPCSMYYNFLIREDANGEKVLNISYHQRSCDYVTHFGNDVYLAFSLMQEVAKIIMVKPGKLIHTIDSLHSYKKDWDKLKTPISTIMYGQES